jgi:hypothetical protein
MFQAVQYVPVDASLRKRRNLGFDTASHGLSFGCQPPPTVLNQDEIETGGRQLIDRYICSGSSAHN